MMANTCLTLSVCVHVLTLVFSQTINVDPNSCGKNTCCSNYFMNGNICTVCRNGTIGTNCSEVCKDGYFGRLCRSQCALSCASPCNKSTGVCSEDSSSPDKLKLFLKENALIIVTVSSVVVLTLFGFTGFLFVHQTCKKSDNVQLKGDTTIQSSVAGSVRQGKYNCRRSHENNTGGERSYPSKHGSVRANTGNKRSGDFNIETSEFLQNSVHGEARELASGEIGSDFQSENEKPKYRYSLATKFIISEELDFCQEFSEDEDIFDSDCEIE